ncbi:MAG: type II secretion system protein J [Desulfobacteraceae bacterium]
MVNIDNCHPLPRSAKGRAQHGEVGFSLLEVMVATALMALVMVAILQVLSAGLQAQDAVQRRTYALLVANKVLRQYGAPEYLSRGSHQGQEGPCTYQVQIKPQYQVSHQIWDYEVICYHLRVRVFWEERGQAKSVTLETLRSKCRRKKS